MQGNKPSGSCPSRVYTSVWHSALAMTFTRISPARGARDDDGLFAQRLVSSPRHSGFAPMRVRQHDVNVIAI